MAHNLGPAKDLANSAAHRARSAAADVGSHHDAALAKAVQELSEAIAILADAINSLADNLD